MAAGRLLADSVARQQTQIFHISTGTRCNNNCGWLSLVDTFPRLTIRGTSVPLRISLGIAALAGGRAVQPAFMNVGRPWINICQSCNQARGQIFVDEELHAFEIYQFALAVPQNAYGLVRKCIRGQHLLSGIEYHHHPSTTSRGGAVPLG